LPLAETGVVAEDDRHPEGLGQLRQRQADGVSGLRLAGDGLRQELGTGNVRHRGRRGVRPAAAVVPHLRAAGVHQYPVEPGPGAVPDRDRCPEAPHAQKGVLHGLLGVSRVSQDQARRAVCGGVARLQPPSQLVGLRHGPPFLATSTTHGAQKRFGDERLLCGSARVIRGQIRKERGLIGCLFMPEASPDRTEQVVNLCKRRGFVFPSSEIYGGFRSTYDYGPLGVLLKRNVMDAWWRPMVQLRDDIVGIDAAILMSPKVWEASGHLATFTDPLVDCRKCKERWREDQIEGVCPNCGSTDLTEARPFNLMFKTFVGPLEDEGSVAYLRPETAQGIFVNFMNVLQTARKKPPFGIAQMGKSFRTETT